MGFITGDEAGQRQDVDVNVFLSMELCDYLRVVRGLTLSCRNARSVILHEMINYLLCMNLVNAEQ